MFPQFWLAPFANLLDDTVTTSSLTPKSNEDSPPGAWRLPFFSESKVALV
jgi:hypothetical protein